VAVVAAVLLQWQRWWWRRWWLNGAQVAVKFNIKNNIIPFKSLTAKSLLAGEKLVATYSIST
jgi:hypothetical protein